jgi:8-oxo-dGTP pyrophosphatase MutT (NUDIX family)
MTRRLFPGCSDLIGGHIEDGEEVLSALRREIHEETGWILKASFTSWVRSIGMTGLPNMKSDSSSRGSKAN